MGTTRKWTRQLIAGLLSLAMLGCVQPPPIAEGDIYFTPEHGLRVHMPDRLFEDGLRMNGPDGLVVIRDPDRIVDIVLATVDSYASYWVATRTAWHADIQTISSYINVVVADCTFPCYASDNGLCAGTTDMVAKTWNSFYRLRRAHEAPADFVTAHGARSREDMQELAGPGSYWSDEQPHDYFWCEAPPDNMGMRVLMHEWDHILPGMDPHDPGDLERVQDLQLADFVSNVIREIAQREVEEPGQVQENA